MIGTVWVSSQWEERPDGDNQCLPSLLGERGFEGSDFTWT